MVPPLMCNVHVPPDRTGWPCPGSQCPVPLSAFKDALNDASLVLGEGWRLKCLQQKGGGLGKVSCWHQRENWGDAVGAESRSPGCLVGHGGHIGTSITLSWGVVLGVRNIQCSVNQRWALEHASNAIKAKTKGQLSLPEQKGQPRNDS